MRRLLAIIGAAFLLYAIVIRFLPATRPDDGHVDGLYVLEAIYIENKQVQILPISMYPDMIWGFYLCNTDKRNLQNLYAPMPNYSFQCIRQGGTI